MPLASRARTAAPELKHLAIKPPRRDMRGIDLRLAFFERAALEIIRLLRRFVVTRIWHHQIILPSVRLPSSSPPGLTRWSMLTPSLRGTNARDSLSPRAGRGEMSDPVPATRTASEFCQA